MKTVHIEMLLPVNPLKFKTKNGWTKQSMIKHITDNFKGKSFIRKEGNGMCLYRGPNDAKCAVGLFIPDHLYDSSMENKAVGAQSLNIINDVLPLDPTAMSAFQTIHDTSHPDRTLFVMLDWINNNVLDDVCEF